MSKRALNSATFARVRENSGLSTSLFEGAAKPALARYAVVFVNTGSNERPRLTGASTRVVKTFTFHSVGTTADQAQWVAERIEKQLLDYTLSVPGWNCFQITHPVSIETQIDRDVTPHLHYNVDQYELVAERL